MIQLLLLESKERKNIIVKLIIIDNIFKQLYIFPSVYVFVRVCVCVSMCDIYM